MSELEQIRKRFHIVGTVELAASGKSVKVTVTDCPLSTSDRVYFINRESIVQLVHGHRKDATVFILEPQE